MLAGIILCGSGLVIHRPGYAQLSGGLIQTAQTCLPTGFNGPFRALRFAQNRQKNSATQRKGPDWPFAMCSVRHGQPVRSTLASRRDAYLPIQKLEKMRPSNSSELKAPVISPSAC